MSTTVLSDLIALGNVSTGPRGRLTREQADDRKKAHEAADKLALERWDDPAFHREVAATLAEEMDWGFWNEALFTSWFPTRAVGATDRVLIREMRGMRAYWVHRGGYIRESQVVTEDFELPRDTIGYHFSEFEDKLKANFGESMETLNRLGGLRVEAEVNRRIFQMLQEAIPDGSPHYVDATTGGLTPEILNVAIREVGDAPRPNGGAGSSGVSIVSRAAGVGAIADFPGYGDQTLEEIRLRGRIGVYHGASIDQVANFQDEDGVAYIPDNEIWVLGGQVGQFVKYGGATSKSWEEDSADYRHYRTRSDMGGAIYHPEYARRIVFDPDA